MKQNKMKLTYKEYLSIALVLFAIAILGLMWNRPWSAIGSVEVGNEYQSVTLPTTADLTNLCPQQFNRASSTTGVLGSVSITSYGSGSLLLLNATTVNNSLRASAATTSLSLAHFPVMATSTYHFDLAFDKGLLVDTEGTVGTTTITYRCQN